MCRLRTNRLAVMTTVVSYGGYKIRLRVALVATRFSCGQAECCGSYRSRLKPPGCCGGFRGRLRTTKLLFVASGVGCGHI